MSHLHQILFLKWLLALSFLACVPKSFASTKSCGDIFESQHSRTSELPSKPSEEFLKLSHALFTSTMTEASNTTSSEEKRDYFSKLAAFAKDHQLSQKNFESWIEQSKMDFIRENFLETQSENKAIAIDPQKLKGLNHLAVEMKLDSMTEFYSTQDFLAELEKQKKIPLQERVFLYNNLVKNTHAMEIFGNIQNFDRIEYAYIFPNHQNPNIRQVIIIYQSKSNESFQLWTFQERIYSNPRSQNDPELWRVIHYMELPKETIFPDYRYLFPLYSPETNQIVLAAFNNRVDPDFKGFLNELEWFYLDIPSDSKVKSLLPHISSQEQSIFSEKMNKYSTSNSNFLEIFFSEKNHSFLFVSRNDFSNGKFTVELNHISAIEQEDFRYTDKVSLQYPKGTTHSYTTLSSVDFSEDGHFVKIQYYTMYRPNLENFSSNTDVIEDENLRYTRYIFPANSLQMQSRKPRSK